MDQHRARSTATPHYLNSPHPYGWLPTTSGMLALTVGLQGAAANAIAATTLTPTKSADITEQSQNTVAVSAPDTAALVEPAPIWPRFSRFKAQQPDNTHLLTMRLENHQRELHRRSNEVESQLLAVQELLSLEPYGTSFADQLLDDDTTYQTKLRQLRLLEADIHTALKHSDEASFDQLQNRLERTDRELRRLAQKQLRRYVKRAQRTSTLGLWQEPMYQESLRWLMERTHERHLLKARQQALVRTMIAMAPD